MGFSNPIIGGGGSLVYPSIHSPDFVTGVSGWTIKKDGSAEFNNLTIRGTFLGADFILSAAGAFFYSGTPAAGNLIASIASTATTDSFGNAVRAGGMAVYGSGGQNIFMGLLGSVTELQFPTGAAMEKTAANVAGGTTGSGTGELLIAEFSGPQGSHAGQQDWCQVNMVSGTNGSGDPANGALAYISNAGVVTEVLSWDGGGVFVTAINGIDLAQGADPGSETSTPGAAFGAPPTGTATQASSFAAGSPALSYLTAVETSYNLTRAALVDLISKYNSLRSQLIASGVIA